MPGLPVSKLSKYVREKTLEVTLRKYLKDP